MWGKGSGKSLTETGRQVEIRTPGRTHEGVVYARSVRRISEHSWSTENLPPASQQKSSSTHHQKCTKRRRKNPQRSQWVTKTKKRKGAIGHHDDASELRAQAKVEKRTETQVATSVKKWFTSTSSKEKRTATFADEPVKRKLTRKTDTMNDDVLAPMESADSYPLNTVNTLLNTVTCALETNPRK